MKDRIPRRWRWLLIETWTGFPSLGFDADECVTSGSLFRWPLAEFVRAHKGYACDYRVVRRREWLIEH